MLYLVPHRIESLPGERLSHIFATDQQPGQGVISLLQNDRRDGSVIGGCYLMWLPLGTNDPGCQKIADDPRETIRLASRNIIGTRFSLTPDATTIDGFVKEMLADRLWCGGPLLPNYQTLKREIILGNAFFDAEGKRVPIWSEGVAPQHASVGYTEDWRTTGTDVTTGQKFNAVYSVSWDKQADWNGENGTLSISADTPNRLTNTHATLGVLCYTNVSAIADTDNNEISFSCRIVTDGVETGLKACARGNSGKTDMYLSVFDRSASHRVRAVYLAGGGQNTVDANDGDVGSGVQGIGVSCSGSTITWTRPGTDYATTDTNIATGRYGGIHFRGGASTVTCESYGDVIWQDVGFTPGGATYGGFIGSKGGLW